MLTWSAVVAAGGIWGRAGRSRLCSHVDLRLERLPGTSCGCALWIQFCLGAGTAYDQVSGFRIGWLQATEAELLTGVRETAEHHIAIY